MRLIALSLRSPMKVARRGASNKVVTWLTVPLGGTAGGPLLYRRRRRAAPLQYRC